VLYLASNALAPHAPSGVVLRLWLSSAARILFVLHGTLLAIANLPARTHAADGGWEYQPYRVQALLAIDVPGGLTEIWTIELPAYLQQRADIALAPLWLVEFKLAAGAERPQVFNRLETQSLPPPKELLGDKDKLLLLSVRRTPTGFELAAREFDQYVQRWGTTLHRECLQEVAVPEQLFHLAREALSPLAQLEPDADNPQRVTLKPRGAEVPRSVDAPPWAKASDVFLPIVRRTARSGQLVENGVQPVAWTYVEAIDGKDKSLEFTVRSGSRRPFAGRRQGRTEQLAIAVRADAGPTTLHLQSRKNENKPLVGYEVLSQSTGQENPTTIGLSDLAGNVRIPPGKSRVASLIVKHGGQLLAKLPIVPGAQQTVNVPLPDDDARLAAEARLAALREDLIDVVARRNILIARARQKINKNDFAGAQELLRALDELPGKPQFDLTINSAKRLLRSDDPLMQRRIDQLFQATQTLTAQFLDVKPVNEIHNELREAQQRPAVKNGKT
jgi:hypothetical protein